MSSISLNHIALRAILALLGLVVCWISLNLTFGGITGLESDPAQSFLNITQPDLFAVQDSHVRFVGGLFLASGLFYIAAAIRPTPMRGIIMGVGIAYLIGGMARLATGDFAVVFGPDILVPFLAEVIVFPLMGYWIYRSTS